MCLGSNMKGAKRTEKKKNGEKGRVGLFLFRRVSVFTSRVGTVHILYLPVVSMVMA